MNIPKKIEKVEKSISKYIYRHLKIPKAVKRFVAIEYSTYHRGIRVFYNGRYIGEVSTRGQVEHIIEDYASKLALSNLKEHKNEK